MKIQRSLFLVWGGLIPCCGHGAQHRHIDEAEFLHPAHPAPQQFHGQRGYEAQAQAGYQSADQLDSTGPVLFRQQRIGRRNHLFHIYKFRSMRAESSDGDGTRSTTRDDDRITRVGSIIRKTSIDELPQLFNVLLGDMSLVGPRPHALGSRAQNMLFWEIDSRYFIRHAVKPGITGIAQVRGYRGATHKREDLTFRLQADLEYQSQWSVWLDLVLMLRTVRVLFHKNAY